MTEPEKRIFEEPAGAASRLHELGVSQVVLQEALQMGLQHAFACTKHDPPVLPGLIAWGKTVRHLRDRLVPEKWKISNKRNYATVIHPSGTFAIAVAAGDEQTGRVPGDPSTRSEKGPATRDAVHNNQLTFADVSDSFPSPKNEPGKQTWLLLHYADEEADEVRAELSLPAKMADDGYVKEWQQRIILGPFSFGAPSQIDHDSDVADDAINIQVSPRS